LDEDGEPKAKEAPKEKTPEELQRVKESFLPDHLKSKVKKTKKRRPKKTSNAPANE